MEGVLNKRNEIKREVHNTLAFPKKMREGKKNMLVYIALLSHKGISTNPQGQIYFAWIRATRLTMSKLSMSLEGKISTSRGLRNLDRIHRERTLEGHAYTKTYDWRLALHRPYLHHFASFDDVGMYCFSVTHADCVLLGNLWELATRCNLLQSS